MYALAMTQTDEYIIVLEPQCVCMCVNTTLFKNNVTLTL